jgi:DNA-binding transcriptional MerR regulator
MKKPIGIGQTAKLVGATVETLQCRDREGRIFPAARTASNRRHYTVRQLRAALEGNHAAGAPDQD